MTSINSLVNSIKLEGHAGILYRVVLARVLQLCNDKLQIVYTVIYWLPSIVCLLSFFILASWHFWLIKDDIAKQPAREMLKHSLMLFQAILCHPLLQTSIAGECASNLGESHETTSNNTPVVYFWAVSIQAACQHWVDMKNQGGDNCEAFSVVSAPPAGKCLPSYPPSFTTTRLHRANPDSIRTATNRKIPSTQQMSLQSGHPSHVASRHLGYSIRRTDMAGTFLCWFTSPSLSPRWSLFCLFWPLPLHFLF